MNQLFNRLSVRPTEMRLIAIVGAITFLGFALTTAVLHTTTETAVIGWAGTLFIPTLFIAGQLIVHFALNRKTAVQEQLIWPITSLLIAIGFVLLWRLLGSADVRSQLIRGWLPGIVIITILIMNPSIIERLRHRWAFYIGGIGLLLILMTAFFGVSDDAGARLSLKLGPLPSIQTTEFVKLSLIIFLAWYIERVGEVAEGRAKVFGWLRLPALKYFIPGLLFVFLSILALVKMSDFGAVPILAGLFVVMFYAGFETRTFVTTALIGLVLSVIAGIGLAIAWQMPPTIQERFLAFQDPWSEAEVIINGEPTGITVSEGPGYQTQQAIYAIVAGGFGGTGLGYGTPYYVPLVHSDYIFAAIAEELGLAATMAILAFFAILFLRILRVAIMLPSEHIFEKLLLVGITVHLMFQIFIMIGGTINLIPPTGVTIPFLSQGGSALLVNMTEIGLALSLATRLN